MKQNGWPPLTGRVSGITQNRPAPVCWIPSRNRMSIDAPLAWGESADPAAADSVLLTAAPCGCDGGDSSVVPRTVGFDVPLAHGGRLTDTNTSPDVRGRKSATPEIEGNVVISTTRKRRRVRF